MDRLSIFGLIVGIGALLVGQLLDGGQTSSLAQLPALVIVIGGTLGAVMLQTPSGTFGRGFRMLRWVWRPPQIDYRRMIEQIVSWSHLARREGLLALEAPANAQQDLFVRKGLQLLVDGAEPDRLRDILEVEVSANEEYLRQAARIWESAGGYAPTIGILGAVMGLIHVMENLTDPSRLGAGIATAFVATIYGVGLANLVFLPIGNKLKLQIARRVTYQEIIVDGLICIANGDNPRLIENRLKGYLT
ncbi:MAG TPA: flagellar motor protein [Rhodocyclaceae bacterium]